MQPDKMSEFLDDFVPCLHQLLSRNDVVRDIKIPAIRALGDLALHCGS